MSSDDDDDDEEPRRDRLFVNWRLYVDHVFNNHFFDHEKMKHFVEVIGGRAEDEVPEGYEVGTTEEREVLYECVRCRDMPRELFTGFSKDRIVEHCEEIHDVEDPVQDTHYCEMYGLAGRTTQEKVYLFDEDRVAYNNELSALLAMSLVMMTEATDMLLRMRR